MFENKRLVILLFQVSIVSYCCFGDQQSHISERQENRPWILELLKRTHEKSKNLKSETTKLDTHLKSQNVQISRIPTDDSSPFFGTKSLKGQIQSKTILFAPKIAIALGAIAVAIATAVAKHKEEKPEEIDVDIRVLNNPTPINDLPMPVTGVDFPSNGCGDNSVRFGASCFPVLQRGPCNRIGHWVTIDPITLQVNSRRKV